MWGMSIRSMSQLFCCETAGKMEKHPPLPGTPSRSELRCNFPVHYLTLSGSFLAAGGDRDVRLRVDATWKMMDLADGGFLK